MSDVPSFNGWTPPVMYDVHIDGIRAATQEDIDRLLAENKALRTMASRVGEALRSAQARMHSSLECGVIP